MEKKLRGGFTGNLGFILAAAGSAVGLGNLWRFPYLAAKDGGGLFILVYIILSLTAGFALMLTEISIGRKTGLNPLQAYGNVHPKFKFLGVLATAIPLIIFPYYCVIGGWVTKYAATYVTGGATNIYSNGAGSFFNGFITGEISPLIWFFIFMAITAVIVLLGVEKGIEKASKIIMPMLIVLILGIVIYSARMVRRRGLQWWQFLLWLTIASLLGTAGYMEYYVQRHGNEALLAYSVMTLCLSVLLGVVLLFIAPIGRPKKEKVLL